MGGLEQSYHHEYALRKSRTSRRSYGPEGGRGGSG